MPRSRAAIALSSSWPICGVLACAWSVRQRAAGVDDIGHVAFAFRFVRGQQRFPHGRQRQGLQRRQGVHDRREVFGKAGWAPVDGLHDERAPRQPRTRSERGAPGGRVAAVLRALEAGGLERQIAGGGPAHLALLGDPGEPAAIAQTNMPMGQSRVGQGAQGLRGECRLLGRERRQPALGGADLDGLFDAWLYQEEIPPLP
mgnify:CR=1 FL=1